MTDDREDHSMYTTVTQGMRGWFAVLMWWNPNPPNLDGFWEPWLSGIGSYKTREEAINEAKDWAEAEGLKFKQ